MLADIGFTLNGAWATLFAFDLFFGLILFLPFTLAFALSFSTDRTDRMAKTLDLALPHALQLRLNIFLRRRGLIRAVVVFLFAQVYFLSQSDVGAQSARAAELVWLPTCVWAGAFAACLLPRWRSEGPTRLAHLQRFSVRDAISQSELVAIVLTYPIGAGIAGWALWRAGDPWRTWFWLPAVVIAAQAVATLGVCHFVMHARAASSDLLELAWDDVLRFDRVRSMLAVSSFATLFFIAAAASDVANLKPPFFVTFMVASGFAAGFRWYWQRSPARANWRRSWPSSMVSQLPGAG